MAYEKETLTKILYYGEISPNSKQFIQDLVDKKDKEIERLNNIIDKLEELLKQPWNVDCVNQNNYFLDKLKELKQEN